ncbi:hypothetical protein RB195_015611 [Necator americanus]|uniref:Polyprotein allergen nematode domain-containing protein n=1 Tax=Necator americanus TaxID=51031 RepID=A0ABR1E5Y9_NECAM
MKTFSAVAIFILLFVSDVNAERGRSNPREPMERQQPRLGSKAVRNLLFASKVWLTADQARMINDLQTQGDDGAVVRQLTEYYRNMGDKSRASLRVQSTCRAILSDEVGQAAVDELIAMKAKITPSSELVTKINSLFRDVKKSDVSVIQPLCAAAYEDSHVPTANDQRRVRRGIPGAAAA